ncbi:hypothetical protein [Actinomadura decatromicini]|uniref:Uncharacterized protein n=1 Tax=Actinomadura decatromicini TaxID=2604572 RepID=A0A5D3FB99_9ACTN|nr:hypothetical protein [Actinomadura decatromicini]TYK46227.1 hypothetical protein FXF68_29000 [Actinomadura decatromicini]
MRAQKPGEEQRRETQRPGRAAPARQTSSGGGTTADSILGLQRLAGNAAVSRILGRRHAPATPVQRMNQDELHRNPQGPSLRIRGPRRSHASGRTPNALTREEWETLPEATRNGSHKERVESDEDPNTLQETDPGLHYSLGSVRRLAPGISEEAGRNEVLEGIGRSDPATRDYWNRQDARDAQLGRDARATLNAYTGTPASRHQRHQDVEQALDDDNSQDAMDDLRALLENYEGVAIGGPHSGAPIWGFLCAHMAEIRQAGVRTLYLESIRDDAYQARVDAYLAGGAMSPELRAFAVRYDGSHNLGATGLRALLEAARTHGMRVKGLDGRPARRPTMQANALYQRAVAMNTYANQVVANDRRRPSAAGAYLMELGARHTGMHPGPAQDMTVHGTPFQAGEEFPGVDDLLDIPAVSFQDDGRLRRLSNS